MKTLLRSVLVFCIFLYACTHLAAFQFADATAPKPAPLPKYIFYWGQQQCDLTAEQQYKGRFTMRPPEFRQMLLSTPKLWNGTGLVTEFSFHLQEFPIHTKTYLTQIASLDQQFGQSVTAGQVLAIRQLDLGNGVTASIEIEITAPGNEKKLVFGAQGYAPFLNAQWMETITWGQEDKLEINQRDFFTVAEFWEIFGQEPYLEWRSWQAATPVTAELQILDAEEVTLSLRFRLEEQRYAEFIRQAQVYRHLFKPGVRATLLLQTSDQYERLYQKSLQLVDEGDERLLFRRNQDFHTLQIGWGEWKETIEHLYLKEVSDRDGKRRTADQPVNRWSMLSNWVDHLNDWARLGPQFRVDNELVEGASYTIQSNDSTFYRVENGQFDPAELKRIFSQNEINRNGWKINNIELPGFSLPFMQFSFRNNLFTREQILLRNNIQTLSLIADSIRGYSIKAPVKDGKEWKFELESPQRSDLIITVFNSENLNVFWEDIIIGAGKSAHSIPANVLTEKGKYKAFLISYLGVTKVEFEVP